MKMNPCFNDPEDNTIKYYDENAHRFIKGTLDVGMESLYRPFLARVPKGSKILDAGCGSGRDSLYFKQHGYDIVSFDASEKLVEVGSKLIKKPVLRLSFDEISFEKEFDGVWASASLLHIPKKRILPILEKLKKSLQKNGIFYVSCKYGEGERSINGRFFSYYNEETLEKIFNELGGFKKKKVWKTEDVRTERKNEYWINILLCKK